MKTPKKPVAKMNAAARVAAWRTSRSGSGIDNRGYRPNPRRSPSDGNVWRFKAS